MDLDNYTVFSANDGEAVVKTPNQLSGLFNAGLSFWGMESKTYKNSS